MDKHYVYKLLVRIARHSDEEAAREFFEIFHPKLVRFAVIYTSSIHDANDLVADVFVKLFRNKRKLDEIKDIQYYLYKAVKNQCITYFKKKKSDLSVNDIEWEETGYTYEIQNPESEFLTKELASEIEEIINGFPPKRKIIYKMVVIDGLKYKEAAEILDLSIKTIENHLSLAVKELRHKIRNYLKSNDLNLGSNASMHKNI
jgi:RNA polymerase sigma-70 factor (ECF subfamily)